MSGERPSNCRNALRDAGKPYPKSGCAVCRNGGMMGCPYERTPSDPPGLETNNWAQGSPLDKPSGVGRRDKLCLLLETAVLERDPFTNLNLGSQVEVVADAIIALDTGDEDKAVVTEHGYE